MENKKRLEKEKRTLEQLLSDLRKEKGWSYLHISEELRKLGIQIDETQIKKWEYGLDYPDLDTLYKLSELYFMPIENFITAKDNSYKKHTTAIRWFCYLTGFTFKIGYFFYYFIPIILLIGALMFFLSKANSFY